MRALTHLRSQASKAARLAPSSVGPSRHVRGIAQYNPEHYASAISILPSNVDKSSVDYRENARQMEDVMARMQELHAKIEIGGPVKAREKHIGRGKMLPREYVGARIKNLD